MEAEKEIVEIKQSTEDVAECIPEPVELTSEPPTKKARKPFVFTEKRKEAFERCRQRREERAREKRASGQANFKEVQIYMQRLKSDKNAPATPLFSTQSITRNTPDSTDCVPRAASNLTMPTTQINLPSQIKLKEETLVLPTATSSTSLAPSQPQEAQAPIQPSTMSETSSPSMEVEAQTSTVHKEEEKKHAVYEEQTRKRKVHFQRHEEEELVGAGNHPRYADEDDEDANIPMPLQYHQIKNVDALDDDTLFMLLAEAKRRTEMQNMYSNRREYGKMQRPSQAALFLDSVASPSQFHPSQLFNSNQIHSAKPKSQVSHFTWL